MQTRMEKYTDAHDEVGYRYKKNEDLYKKISDQELDKYTVKANATVLSDSGNSIDIDHIKKILETRYNEAPKRKSITIPDEEPVSGSDEIETKEYDINLILEKAKEQESIDYDKNRFKKLRDTQYDILKDLNLSENLHVSDDKVDGDELRELINTITQKELENRKGSEDPLDLFPDLKGEENTVLLDGMKDEIENTSSVSTNDDNTSIDKSFYTTTSSFTQSDFDDFEDLKKEVKGHKIVLIIVTILIIAALLFGIFYLLNNFLGVKFF